MQRKYFPAIFIAIIILSASAVLWQSKYNFIPREIFNTFSGSGEKFPDIEIAKLSPARQKIVALTAEEFNKQPDYKKYSEGNSEPWCADFVSWIYKEAGVPFTNPHSGTWRIPGTFTLRDYLKSEHRLKDATSTYVPKPGDLMLYDNPSPFGQHVNIVLKVNETGYITTIGGNEPGGIRVKTHEAHLNEGFVGYGILE